MAPVQSLTFYFTASRAQGPQEAPPDPIPASGEPATGGARSAVPGTFAPSRPRLWWAWLGGAESREANGSQAVGGAGAGLRAGFRAAPCAPQPLLQLPGSRGLPPPGKAQGRGGEGAGPPPS